MKKILIAFWLFGSVSLFAQTSNNENQPDYKIITGRFENGTHEQQEAYTQLFGADSTQYKFDLYFHWYNIVHEYGHCILDFYNKGIGGVDEEILVNKFAVSYWKYVGFEDELAKLKTMLETALSGFPNPIPENRTFIDWYSEIWGTQKLMSVPIYGYFQFKSVIIAIEESKDLSSWFDEIEINGFVASNSCKLEKYPIVAESSTKYLNDLQNLLKVAGLKCPTVDIELTNDPMTHCSQKVY